MKKAILLFALCAIYISVFAQTKKSYAATETAALVTDLNAGAYDIYELTTSGGDYQITATTANPILLTKTSTITAASGLSSKPIVRMNNSAVATTAVDPVIFFKTVTPSISITLNGIEFDGRNVNTAGDNPDLLHISVGATNSSVTSSNCYIHDFTNSRGNNCGVFRLCEAGTSITVSGCVVNKCNYRTIQLYTVPLTYGNIIIENSAFTTTTQTTSNNNIISMRAVSTNFAGVNKISINHCVFNNYNTSSVDEIIRTRDSFTGDKVFSLTNSLFVGVVNKTMFDLATYTTAPVQTITYNYLAGITTTTGTVYPAQQNSFTTAPAFKDATNLDFSLTNLSSFTCPDGKPAGILSNNISGIESLQFNKLTMVGNDVKSSETGLFDVFNMTGKKLISKNNSNEIVLNLEKGVYIVRFTALNQKEIVQKVVVQ